MKELLFSSQNPLELVGEDGKKIFNFLNLYSLYLFFRNDRFMESISSGNAINFPDGTMIARHLGLKQQRGPSFTRDFLKGNEARYKKHFFIGLNLNEIPKLSEITSIPENKINSYNPSRILGIEFPPEEKKKMIKEVNKFRPDFLWVCVGNPKQEILSYELFEKVKVEKIFNVGAALDFLLGKKKEAPKFWRGVKLEWLYLGITNPKRTLKKIKGSFIALPRLKYVKTK